jgi:hypothetical protein
MDKVNLRVMAKSEELLTNSEDGLKVKITLKDGRVFEHATPRGDILGSQKNPWGFDSIKGKFEVNAGMVLQEDRVAETIETWSDIGEVTDLSETIKSTLVSAEK